MLATFILAMSTMASFADAQTIGSVSTDEAATLPSLARSEIPNERRAAVTFSSSEPVEGAVATLTRLVTRGQVTTLRSSSAGNYRAQLLFCSEGLTYYVALFQNDAYWRVVSTANKRRAEFVYADFVTRTVRLSDVKDRQTELEAKNAATQRSLEQ
jgi:hypothetical protein